jgi:hypothetical protein
MKETKTGPKLLLERRLDRALKSGDLAGIEGMAGLVKGELRRKFLGHALIGAAMKGDLVQADRLVKGLRADARYADDSALRWAAVLKSDGVTRFLAERVFSAGRWKKRTKAEILAEVKVLGDRIGRSCAELKKEPDVERRAMEIVQDAARRAIERLGL